MLRAALGSTVSAVLDLLAPLRCPVCRAELGHALLCPSCAFPGSEHVVRQLRRDGDEVFLVFAGARFEGVARAMVHALKYRQDPAALRLLARQTGLAVPADLRWDALVPVPAHRTRARERGWEPVMELTRLLARSQRLPYAPALRRVRYTQPLAGRDRWERSRIVASAFRARPVSGHLLVVDDVGTTGATFLGCRRALLGAGARSVDLLVAALTPPPGLGRQPGTLCPHGRYATLRAFVTRGRGTGRGRLHPL